MLRLFIEELLRLGHNRLDEALGDLKLASEIDPNNKEVIHEQSTLNDINLDESRMKQENM